MGLEKSFGVSLVLHPGKKAAGLKSRRGLCVSPTGVFVLTALACAALSAPAQVLARAFDKYDMQVHGYATQGFLYTTRNNIFTTRSSDGSFDWDDAVVSVGSTPLCKLRIAAQVRYSRFGKYSNSASLDWAQADFKLNEHFGLRAGKVKTPVGLFNEVQDIDPAYIWSLLPQSIYAVYNRSSVLTHEGGIVYGSVPIGERLGKVEYRSWLGNQAVGKSDDGSFVALREQGLYMPDGLRGPMYGATLHWKTPLPGFMLGASDFYINARAGRITTHQGFPLGSTALRRYNLPQYFAKYEKGKVLAAAEYARVILIPTITFTGAPGATMHIDLRNWYGMASYKATSKLTTGLYYSQQVNHSAPPGPAQYSKDWALAGRYDFNQYIYAKAEQHFVDGTAIGYDTDLNPNGPKPDTRLTILKIGFSF